MTESTVDRTDRALQDAVRGWELTQFLYTEAALLDAGRFWDWLDLFTEDLHYWMPIRRTVARGDEDRAFTREVGEHSYFDEDRTSLRMRIEKLETGYSWSEDPPSRTRHLVANVQVVRDDGNEVDLTSAFVVYRSRLGNEEELWVGRRLDTLRQTAAGWRIARRHIFLDQSLLSAKNLSSFF